MTRDLREYQRQTTNRLILGFLLLVFLVGDGLIYVIYGPRAAITGLVCLAFALVPVALTGLALSLLGWIVKKSNSDGQI